MKRIFNLLVAMLPLLGLVFLMHAFRLQASPSHVSGTIIVVNSSIDGVDINPGNGICDAGNGFCTLRAAIQEANALAGTDSIFLSDDTYTLTLVGVDEDNAATGDLDIMDDLVINGVDSAASIIDANGIDRAIDILAPPTIPTSITVIINNVTIQNGFVKNPGGGISIADGDVQINNSKLISNSTGWSRLGGGIYNNGRLTINNTDFYNNLSMTGGWRIFLVLPYN